MLASINSITQTKSNYVSNKKVQKDLAVSKNPSFTSVYAYFKPKHLEHPIWSNLSEHLPNKMSMLQTKGEMLDIYKRANEKLAFLLNVRVKKNDTDVIEKIKVFLTDKDVKTFEGKKNLNDKEDYFINTLFGGRLQILKLESFNEVKVPDSEFFEIRKEIEGFDYVIKDGKKKYFEVQQ